MTTAHPHSSGVKGADRTKLLVLIGLVLAVTAVYWSSLEGDFVAWDDYINIVNNQHVQSLDAQQIAWMFTDTAKALRYKPLSWLSWALIYRAVGLNPVGFHVANLLLHYVNTILVFQLLLGLFSRKGQAGPEIGRVLVCAWAALVWAIHPLRVEPVAWITGLPYGLSLLFLLISLLLYLQSNDDSTTERRRKGCYWASVTAFLFSALSYPNGLTFPLALLVIDVFPLRRWCRKEGVAGLWKLSREKVPYLLIAFLFVAMTLNGRMEAQGIWSKPGSLADFGLLSRLMQAFYIWAYYAWKFWLPIDLSPVYMTLFSFNPLAAEFLSSAGFVIALTIWLLCKRRQMPLLTAAWFCHLALLIPVLGLTEHPHFPSDRYGFIVGMVWAIVLAAGLMRLLESVKLRGLAVTSAAVALVCFGWLSFRQIEVWHDSVTVYQRVVESDPDNPLLYGRLGAAYAEQHRYSEALESYRKATKLDPGNPELHRKIAALFFKLDQLPEAQQHYVAALSITAEVADDHNNLGAVLAARGDLENAIAEFRIALRLNPELAGAKRNLARALSEEGRVGEAKASIQGNPESLKKLPTQSL